MSQRWQFWVDRGGTFTDVVARHPDGRVETLKLLSEDPGRYDDAAVAAIRRLTGCAQGPLPAADIRIGTTIATNALLERRGEPVLLAITRGFADALIIGTQDRPDIFARHIQRPPPLHAGVIEIDERVSHDGEVLQPLDADAARAALGEAFGSGLRAVAIVLMHGYRHGAHEEMLAEIAAEIGFEQISVSNRVSPLARLIGRGDTSVVDAYLSPVLGRYVAGFERALGGGQAPLFMQSSGGLVAAGAFRGKDAILSGPAGGIVGMAETAKAAGFDQVIGFDMGGTSTDVSLFAGRYERDNESIVAGARIRAPMLRIHTVAAGGGSICGFDGGRLTVGPASAGAVPGPACYRRGGPLTVTDCNLLLGKLQPAHFPHLFGPDGDQPIDRAAAEARIDELVEAVTDATRTRPSRQDLAEGLVAIAVASMANAIRAISIARGHDVARFVLACFGGAGGQHACLVADALGIDRVMIHPFAGVLSAYGMGLADRRELRQRTIAVPLEADALPAIEAAADTLETEARAALAAQGVDGAMRIERRAHIRPRASETSFDVPLADIETMRAAFDTAFRQRFGYAEAGPLVVDMLGAEAIATTAVDTVVPALSETTAPPVETVEAHMAGEARLTPVHRREQLSRDSRIAGPALIVDPVATTVVEPGWEAAVDAGGSLILTRIAPRARDTAGAALDPVRLEIFSGLFMAIAEEMGAALRHSASSVNIRERLDFSCALFDAAGNLVANAPHIPVHLGSMSESVRAIIAGRSADGRGLRRGDVYALNAPYRGGTHLPDITVIQPVFVDELADTPDFFVAARGHHADVGGISPGSMPPNSRSIEDEGVILDDVLLVENGRLREAEIRTIFAAGAHPARNIDQNIADLAAQIAACARGASGLSAACDDHSRNAVSAYMAHVQDHSERVVRRLIRGLSAGRASSTMDSGATIAVSVAPDADSGTLRVDFAGTSAQQPDNLNAPPGVVRAAVLYVIRTLIDEPVPLNDGFLRAVEIRVPERSMLDPHHPAAVVAGNVETSQVITDALFAALGALAGSQGTMNNFTFGSAAHQYYETIGGGSGAGRGFSGTAAVQTHMTNSRLTDPEILEQRFPVLVEQFAIRRGSGGAGEWPGGDGAVRRIRFRAPMRAGILSNHRATAPAGIAGGEDGQPGINRVERADGRVETLPATAAVEMDAGDLFEIQTPGGGGFGRAG